jgi:glycosyltransferase involved in cell wall biosynthesis
MSNINLSAVVITKNEQDNIVNCLKSLSFCDEVIVIDDLSTDNTVSLAKKLGATIYTRELTTSFSDQRNSGLSKAKGKWVLFIDADEIVSKNLQKEILSATKKEINYTSGYFFRRKDHVWGQVVSHGEVGDIRLLRLAKKGSGKWERQVHEYWHIIGDLKTFINPIEHYPHPTVENFLEEVNERSTLHALANKKEGKKSNLGVIFWYPIFKFIYGYIIKFGFLDGVAGFVIAVVMSLHSFLSWSKLWFMQKK